MSSALLYLAIVAIWAVFLVPAWLRRPHGQRQREDGETSEEAGAEAADHDDAAERWESGEQVAARGPRTADRRPAYSGRGEVPAWPADPPGRDRILRARRRMLITLIALTSAAAAAAEASIVGWWACIPPAGMLALYLLLLREVALADAEIARMRPVEVEVRAARPSAATASTGSQPTATVIDISRRVSDQLYDQYADAAARAVGD